ncbi:MAG: single-stranded-DNA-specific exonuclease RecJ [Pseudomonadota bacterium]
MDDSAAFLDVNASATGRRWQGPDPETERLALAIAQAEDVPDAVGRVLAARGVAPDEAGSHLDPTLRDLLPDPSLFTDMDRAARRLVDAVLKRDRIAIFGDYDVDGAASVALLLAWLGELDRTATAYIPDRIAEGYGPNIPAMSRLAEGHGLILCVDCGTQSHEAVSAARAKGAEVLILDHHLPGEILPEAEALVNPNRPDCASGHGHLCAAGVVYLLLIAANRLLRRKGAVTRSTEPRLLDLLDLVALATVADVAPMIGLNRAFVRQGIRIMARRHRPGLAALADTARLTAPPTARDLGFALAPRINAGGRVGGSDLGLRLLSSREPAEAVAIAEQLDRLNTERRRIEAEVLAAATAQIEARGASSALVWAAGEGWHPGVVGIAASRLKDRFNRPAVVIGLSGSEGKGSGRSVPGIDLGSVVSRLARDGLLTAGGGHAMAAGLSVETAHLPAAMGALAAALAAQGAPDLSTRSLILDGVLAPAAATVDLVETLEAAGPFGPANRPPRFAFPAAVPVGLRSVGQGHIAFRLPSRNGPALEAIAFRCDETGLGPVLRQHGESRAPLHLAGSLEIDDWGGRRRAKLRVEDAAVPG